MYKRLIKGVEQVVYDNEKEYALYHEEPLTYWREGNTGQWIKTDDGKVCKILKRGKMGKVEYVRCLMGTHVVDDKSRIEGNPPKNIYSLCGDKYPHEQRMGRENLTSPEVVFVQHIIKGDNPTQAYLKSFPTNNKEYAKLTAGLLLKTDRIKRIMSKRMVELMDEMGLTDDYLLGEIKTVIEDAESDHNKLKAIDTLLKLKDAYPRDTKKTDMLIGFKGFSSDQLEALQGREALGGKTEIIQQDGIEEEES